MGGLIQCDDVWFHPARAVPCDVTISMEHTLSDRVGVPLTGADTNALLTGTFW